MVCIEGKLEVKRFVCLLWKLKIKSIAMPRCFYELNVVSVEIMLNENILVLNRLLKDRLFESIETTLLRKT